MSWRRAFKQAVKSPLAAAIPRPNCLKKERRSASTAQRTGYGFQQSFTRRRTIRLWAGWSTSGETGSTSRWLSRVRILPGRATREENESMNSESIIATGTPIKLGSAYTLYLVRFAGAPHFSDYHFALSPIATENNVFDVREW